MTREETVSKVRTSWYSLGNHLLSIGSDCENNLESIVDLAIRRAYPPAVRRAFKITNKEASKISRMKASLALKKALIKAYYNNTNLDFGTIIKEIHAAYSDNPNFTCGNAQKFVCMTIKYVLSCDYIDCNNSLFVTSWVPIDRATINLAKELGVNTNNVDPWSKCEDLEAIKQFNEDLRVKVKEKYNIEPLYWECYNWKSPQAKG